MWNYDILTAISIRYTKEDKRKPIPQLFVGSTPLQIGSNVFGKDSKLSLRSYQVDAVNAVLREHRGVVKCATGGGKTLILAAILKALDARYV